MRGEPQLASAVSPLPNGLQVELPVCTECEPPLIGKRPQVLNAGTPLKHYCKGTIERPHPKHRMEMRLFVEAEA